eukprot:SAG25_NODE_9654_length_364_cov_0.532075_1_plen_66_part_00
MIPGATSGRDFSGFGHRQGVSRGGDGVDGQQQHGGELGGVSKIGGTLQGRREGMGGGLSKCKESS